MLRSFSYVNSELLDQFVAQVEDGLRSSQTRNASSGSTKGGKVDIKAAAGELGASKEKSESSEFADAPAARFQRLTDLVSGHEEDFGWVDVVSDADLENARVGNIVDVAADLFESDLSKMSNLAKTLPGIANFGEALRGTGRTVRLPGQNDLDAVAALSAITSGAGILGEVGDSTWKVAFALPPLASPVEGEFRVTGKVTRVVKPGGHEIIPGTPFIEQMPRELRRKFVSEGPKPGQEQMWLEGPALILSVVAIYS